MKFTAFHFAFTTWLAWNHSKQILYIIGTLSVNGDPSEEDGNISLKLQEKDAALGIAPGTKNLTLLRALDREEKRGPSNVYVNVRCDRRRTTDPVGILLIKLAS